MSMRIAKILLITGGLAALCAGQTNRPIAGQTGQTDWPSYGHDPEATQFSPLKQITPENVSNLKVAWTYDFRPETPTPPATAATVENEGAGRRPPRARSSQTTPLVVGNVMYLGTPYGRVHAFNATTGAVIWETDLGAASGRRGLAYWPGNEKHPPRILIGTGNGLLLALDAKSGKPVESFGEKGRVNLRIGVADNFPRGRYGMSSPPAVYQNLVFTGAQLQEEPATGPGGAIRAWDAITGKLVWTFHTIPQPGEANHETWTGDEWVDRSGANVWGFMSVDPERGMLFAPIGTPTPDFYGGTRKGLNLYGSSLLALDARTGSLRWYFQTTHHDNWDYDLCAAPVLLTIRHGNREIPAVAQWTKQGLLFFFNRLTGEPIYGVEERKVPSDNPIPGDENWPTQPFPLKPPPLARMSFQPDEIATVTSEHKAFCKELLNLEGGALMGGPYAQHGSRLRVVFPSWVGGGNWSTASYNPQLGYIYVTLQNLGNLDKVIPKPNGEGYSRVGSELAPPNTEGYFWDGKKQWPCQKPPWAEIVAVNAHTGAVAWRSPLGSFEELDKMGIPKTGIPEHRGGSIVTAGGVVFIGATNDAKFRAYDAKTGKELWSTSLSDSAKALPISFRGNDGNQYVAIVANGGSVRGPENPGGRLYVFRLP